MKKALITLFLLVAILSGLTAVFFNELILWGMTPRARFDPAYLPAAPDYADPAAWSALPERQDAADVALPELPAAPQASAGVDVFYVHPTTYVGRQWNADVSDPKLNDATDRLATLIQASVWNACCAIYAPRYRQATGTAFTNPSADGQRAIDLAYQDVAAAFHRYISQYNHGRPFILSSHSQGSIHALRLLREEISGKPLREKLVAAYIIGAPISTALLSRELPDVPACASADQTGCIVSYNARGPRYRPGTFEFRLPGISLASGGNPAAPPLCINPLSWKQDELPIPAAQNEGALFLDSQSPAVLPHFASAQCRNGTLILSEIGKPPRSFLSKLLDRALGPENYHPIEYQLFYLSMRRNVKNRIAAIRGAGPGRGH